MLDLTVYALPFFFILIGLEILIGNWKKNQSYSKSDTIASLSLFAGNVLVILATKSLFFIFYTQLYEYRIFTISANQWGWIAHFIAIDFVFYWFHRASHRVRFLWASHVNHHSSEHLNFATALRQSWTGPFMRPLFYWVLPILGFNPMMILTMGSLATIYGFCTHTEHINKLGILEWIFVTPSHHRMARMINTSIITMPMYSSPGTDSLELSQLRIKGLFTVSYTHLTLPTNREV